MRKILRWFTALVGITSAASTLAAQSPNMPLWCILHKAPLTCSHCSIWTADLRLQFRRLEYLSHGWG